MAGLQSGRGGWLALEGGAVAGRWAQVPGAGRPTVCMALAASSRQVRRMGDVGLVCLVSPKQKLVLKLMTGFLSAIPAVGQSRRIRT